MINLNKNYSLKKIVGTLLCFFCFFPFISFINIGTDMQPYVLVIATIYIIFFKIKNVKSLRVLWGILIYSTIIAIFNACTTDSVFNAFRSYYNYISLCFVTVACYNFFIYNKGFSEKMVKIFILIWAFVGFVQRFAFQSFMIFLVPLYRTSFSRGASSLASEPSFYGYMCFFFFILALNFKKNKYIFLAICVGQILFLAQSSVSLLYVMLVFGFYCISFLKLDKLNFNTVKKIMICVVIILLAIVLWDLVFSSLLSGSRIGTIINSIRTQGIKAITNSNDKSIQDRFNSIADSFTIFFENYGLPTANEERIMSGYGTVLVELGIPGVALICYIMKTIWVSKIVWHKSVSIALTLIMFSAIQVGVPIFAFLIAYCLYSSKEHKDNLNIDLLLEKL